MRFQNGNGDRLRLPSPLRRRRRPSAGSQPIVWISLLGIFPWADRVNRVHSADSVMTQKPAFDTIQHRIFSLTATGMSASKTETLSQQSWLNHSRLSRRRDQSYQGQIARA